MAPSHQQVTALIAYIQSLGFKMADARMARQRCWKAQLLAAYLAAHVPPEWMAMPNPYPPTEPSLARVNGARWAPLRPRGGGAAELNAGRLQQAAGSGHRG